MFKSEIFPLILHLSLAFIGISVPIAVFAVYQPHPVHNVFIMDIEKSIFWFATFSFFSLLAFIIYTSIQHSPPANYRKTFDKTIECRQALSPEKSKAVDTICGKLPQWSEFNGSQKSS